MALYQRSAAALEALEHVAPVRGVRETLVRSSGSNRTAMRQSFGNNTMIEERRLEHIQVRAPVEGQHHQCGEHGRALVNQVLGEPRAASSSHGTEQASASAEKATRGVNDLSGRTAQGSLGSFGGKKSVELVQLNEDAGSGPWRCKYA